MISDYCRRHIIRLGGSITEPVADDPITALRKSVSWPSGEYTRSLDRCRLEIDDEDEYEDDELEDMMAWLRSLSFLNVGGERGFWDGWQDDFSGTDPSIFFPFAVDEVYFYFLRQNEKAPLDPCIYIVDHEETDSEPYHEDGFTVSFLLAVLEPDASGDG